ncbi:MAG: hypothetical protein KKG00_17410, partial [Bacteroidetes bacterium]|nr:hypothetical protein [Bacteroidota bacterium]
HALFRFNPARFHELGASMKAKQHTFHAEIASRVASHFEEHDSIMHKVWVLSQTDRFSAYHEDELTPLCCTLVRFQLAPGEVLDQEAFPRFGHALWLVAIGEVTVRVAEDPLLPLGSFEMYEQTDSPSAPIHIEAQVKAEIYCLDGQKVAGLKGPEPAPNVQNRLSESETAP